MPERLDKISRCAEELYKAYRDMPINPTGALISQLDWISELHYLLYE